MTDAEKQKATRQLVIDASRRLRLSERVPEEFRRRGWPVETDIGDLVAVAALAVACCAIGAYGQAVRLPERSSLIGGGWEKLPPERATALDIVAVLNLKTLCADA